MIAEPVNVAVQSATTWGKSLWSAISGAIERRAGEIIASTAPITNAMTNSGHIVPGSIWLYTTRADRAPGPTEQEQAGHAPPVEAVGHPAADEDEQHGRDELGEPDPADVEFVARDVEGLLEQDRDEDVEADRGERRRPQVAPDGRVPQDVSGAGHGGTLPTSTAAAHPSFASENPAGHRIPDANVDRGVQSASTYSSIGVGIDVEGVDVADHRRRRRSPPRRRRRDAKISSVTVTMMPPTP